MVRLSRHLSWRELNRLADDELDADSRGLAIEHVAACPKCSGRLSFLGSLRNAGRDMRHPTPPRELLEDVLRSRSEGLRSILPAISAPQRSPRRALPAVAAVAIIASLALLAPLFFAPEAGAGVSELKFDPPRPVPGEEVHLSYRPATELAGEAEVRLRLRLRRPDSEPPRETLGTHAEVILRPDAEGRYIGSFQLPPDFAFASMAVETSAGDRVDDRGGRLWSMRAHGDDGTPRLGALRQEFLVLQNRSWPDAAAVLHEMTLLYPERAEGWSLQLAHELPVQLPDEAAAGLARHREIFRGLQNRAERLESSAEETAAMARYAASLEDTAAFGEWLARLEALDAAHRLVVSARVSAFYTEPVQALAYLERLWSTHGSEANAIYKEGFQAAIRAGDRKAAHRWALRGLDVDGDDLWIRDLALALVMDPETRERGISEIRRLLAHLGEAADEVRPLNSTLEEVHRGSLRLRANLRVELAEQLMASGDLDAAMRELEAADSLGQWLPELYRARLEARLLEGGKQAALADFHRLDADPVYSRKSVDSLRHRLPPVSTADLRAGRERAESEMVQRVLANQFRRGLPPSELRTSTGQPITLESLLAGRPAVLLVWDRRVFGSAEDTEEVVRARNLLAGGPGQLLWVTSELDSESLQVFIREAGLGLPAHHDPRSKLGTALGEWGSRGYYVIDRAGMIRARTDSLMEAVRHLEVLLLGSRDTA
jgi:hypothetical protein